MTIQTYYNEQHNITICIGARQSGKTETLINESIDYVLQHHRNDRHVKAIIISPNRNMCSIIRDRINYRLDRLGLGNIRNRFVLHVYGHINNSSIINLSQINGYELFFDEFEHMKYIPVVKNSYYSGSIVNRVRESITFKILDWIGIGSQESDFLNLDTWSTSHNHIFQEDIGWLPPLEGIRNVPAREWSQQYDAPELNKMTEEESYLYRLGL